MLLNYTGLCRHNSVGGWLDRGSSPLFEAGLMEDHNLLVCAWINVVLSLVWSVHRTCYDMLSRVSRCLHGAWTTFYFNVYVNVWRLLITSPWRAKNPYNSTITNYLFYLPGFSLLRFKTSRISQISFDHSSIIPDYSANTIVTTGPSPFNCSRLNNVNCFYLIHPNCLFVPAVGYVTARPKISVDLKSDCTGHPIW